MHNKRFEKLFVSAEGGQLYIGYYNEPPCFIVGFRDIAILRKIAPVYTVMSERIKRPVSGVYDQTNNYETADNRYLFDMWCNGFINNIEPGLSQKVIYYDREG